MAEAVELEFRQAVKRLVPRTGSLLVAVSGGCDSVSLLHLLNEHAKSNALPLRVAHLDHALRDGSSGDAGFVSELASRLGLVSVIDRREVATLRSSEESLEEAARRVRREFLLEQRDADRDEWIVTGHTLDDQAETLLMRWARGGGPTALLGMQERGPGPFLRPLLAVERLELRRLAQRRGWHWREDPSNASEQFDRNRVRRRLLPELAEQLNPQIARHLVSGAELLREDVACLDEMARVAFSAQFEQAAGALRADPAALRSLPRPILRRVLRDGLLAVGLSPRRAGRAQIDALERLLPKGRGASEQLPEGACARLDEARQLWIEPSA